MDGNKRKVQNLTKQKTTKSALNFGGKNNELWCKGGEVTFISNMIKESFEFKKSPFGENWQPLKPSTIKAKKGKGDILRFSGDLADKWNIEATNTRVGVFGNATAKSYPYGAVHQYGTSKAGRNRKTKIPGRRFLPIDDSGVIENGLKEEIEDLLIEELKKAVE
mgnify:CR=1 FL=1